MTGTTAKFCFNCGVALPKGAKFCPECGTSMQAIGGVPAPAPTEPASAPPTTPAPEPPVTESAPSDERRQVTILFIDLTGYTSLSNELGAEKVHALLQHFFTHVETHGF